MGRKLGCPFFGGGGDSPHLQYRQPIAVLIGCRIGILTTPILEYRHPNQYKALQKFTTQRFSIQIHTTETKPNPNPNTNPTELF